MVKTDPSSGLGPDDLSEAATLVRRYWAAHLYVRVLADSTPSMNWRVVVLPESFTEWSRDHLVSILLHEWGHRMISPVSPQRGAIWRKVAEKRGLGRQQAQMVVNLATDFWIDRFYLENPDWCEVYWRGESEGTRRLGRELRERGRETKTTQMMLFLHEFYRRLLVETRERAGGSESRVPEQAQDLTPEIAGLVDEAWTVSYDESRPEGERIARLADLLEGILPPSLPIPLLSWYPFRGDEINGTEITGRLIREARRAGLSDADLREIFGERRLRRHSIRSRRLEMYARVVPVVDKFLRRLHGRQRTGYKLWHPGRPLRELDILATFHRAPVLLPGVTTLAEQLDKRGVHPGRGRGTVVLVVDDSASTEGDVLLREREAAFSVIAAARRFGDPVGLVAFGSNVTASIEPTSQYHVVEDRVLSLNSSSGGTELQPALVAAYEHVAGQQSFALMIMTDAEVADLSRVASFVEALPSEARCISFCFGSGEDIRETLGALATRRFRVLAASAETTFAEEALEEIYG